MNGPLIGERIVRIDSSDNVEGFGKETNEPERNLDPLGDDLPEDATLINQTPMGGTVAAVRPVSEIPINEVPVPPGTLVEVPMGGTISAAGPMDITNTHEAPMDEMIIHDEVTFEPEPNNAPEKETLDSQSTLNKPISYETPKDETISRESPITANVIPQEFLLTREESEQFRARWNEIQVKFVDEPRTAVQQADELVSEVTEKITRIFTSEHGLLEGQWKQGNEVSTEDLRKALQRYRSFFNRIVT
jgi:hypothetical protein